MTTTIEPPALRVAAFATAGIRASALPTASTAARRFVLAGTGNGSGSSPWTWTALQLRPSAVARAGGRAREAASPQGGDGLGQRNVGREAEAVAERVRRRLGADPQHLDVDRAGADDAAGEPADLLRPARATGAPARSASSASVAAGSAARRMT